MVSACGREVAEFFRGHPEAATTSCGAGRADTRPPPLPAGDATSPADLIVYSVWLAYRPQACSRCGPLHSRAPGV